MKEVDVEIIVPNCTAQAYFDAIYAGDAALRSFHAKVNGDAAACADAWGPDGSRAVRFTMPMNVPAMLKKVIGMDAVPVVETQRVEWGPGRSSFKLVSEPQLNFPGANKFTTSGFLAVSTRPDGSCSVKATMQCAASMPWPMSSTVEGLMATEAAASITKFLEWCRNYYASWRAEQEAVPEPPAAAVAPPPLRPQRSVAASADGDTFYDALEDEALAAAAAADSEGEGAAEVVPYQPPRLEDVIVDCLRHIQASSAETAATLKSLEAVIRNMDENMQVLRDKLVGRRAPSRPAPAASSPPAQAAAASSTAPPASPAPRAAAAAGGRYLSTLAAVALVCGAGSLAYMRYRGHGAAGGGSG